MTPQHSQSSPWPEPPGSLAGASRGWGDTHSEMDGPDRRVASSNWRPYSRNGVLGAVPAALEVMRAFQAGIVRLPATSRSPHDSGQSNRGRLVTLKTGLVCGRPAALFGGGSNAPV